MSNAGSKQDLDTLHSALTKTFKQILSTYLDNPQDKVGMSDELSTPSPAMLSCIAKFLKDNSISFSDDELNELAEFEQALTDHAARRPASVSVLREVLDG